MNNTPTKKQKSSIKEGDLFQLGEHKLICGDATNENHINKLLAGERIKSVITDPPYGVNYVEGKDWVGLRGLKHSYFGKFKNIQGDKLTGNSYKEFSIKWIKPIINKLQSYNTFYIFNADKEVCQLRKALEEVGIYYSQTIIWIKQQKVLGRTDFNPQHELIVYGWKGHHRWKGAKESSVLFYPRPTRSKLHPTMKPIGLLRKLILHTSQPHEIIYDSFGGSGSTLIAAEQTKRSCRMIEMEPEYCQVIINRWEKLTGQKAKKL